jgi:5-hydroxyisourate hydrolase-like protein (transthyretin family)
MKFFIKIFLPFCFLMVFAMSMQFCAVQIPPTGGPRDSIAPILLSATIKDSTLNFNAKAITFKFNEFIEGQDIGNKLFINPLPVKSPSVSNKLNAFTINFKDSLLPNTTYSIQVLGGIKDLNEGNAIPVFKYLFSTGNTIAKGSLSGKVFNAATGQPDSTLFVMLYTEAKDSAVFTTNPKYVTKCKGDGSFTLNNIANNTYYVYALETEMGSYNYNNNDKKFAFNNAAIIINNNEANATLQAFVAEKEKEKDKQKTTAVAPQPKETDKRLKFSPLLPEGKQDLLSILTCETNKPLKSIDASKMKLLADNINKNFEVTIDSLTNKKITLKTDWKENAEYALYLQKEFITDTLGNNFYKALDTIKFSTKKNADYGSLEIVFKNLPSKNALLQIILNDNVISSTLLTSNKFYQKLFVPGSYKLRIVQDDNNNKQWDTGNFFKGRKQPEKVYYIKEVVSVKANFDKQYNVEL